MIPGGHKPIHPGNVSPVLLAHTIYHDEGIKSVEGRAILNLNLGLAHLDLQDEIAHLLRNVMLLVLLDKGHLDIGD